MQPPWLQTWRVRYGAAEKSFFCFSFRGNHLERWAFSTCLPFLFYLLCQHVSFFPSSSLLMWGSCTKFNNWSLSPWFLSLSVGLYIVSLEFDDDDEGPHLIIIINIYILIHSVIIIYYFLNFLFYYYYIVLEVKVVVVMLIFYCLVYIYINTFFFLFYFNFCV